MEDLRNWTTSVRALAEIVGLHFGLAAVILVVGWWLSGVAGRAVRRLAARSTRVDATIVPMAYSLVVWSTRIFVVVAVLARLGIQTASIIAVLGAAGLAIGLALQGTLQNIAAGIMLLVLRPLRAGESVSVVGRADGTVEEVGLFLCRFRQSDGTSITLPNSLVWGNAIINYSRNSTRRLDLELTVPAGDDIDKVLSTLKAMLRAHRLALRDPEPEAMAIRYGENTVVVNIRVWTMASDYWQLRYDVYRTAPAVLREAGLNPPVS